MAALTYKRRVRVPAATFEEAPPQRQRPRGLLGVAAWALLVAGCWFLQSGALPVSKWLDLVLGAGDELTAATPAAPLALQRASAAAHATATAHTPMPPVAATPVAAELRPATGGESVTLDFDMGIGAPDLSTAFSSALEAGTNDFESALEVPATTADLVATRDIDRSAPQQSAQTSAKASARSGLSAPSSLAPLLPPAATSKAAQPPRGTSQRTPASPASASGARPASTRAVAGQSCEAAQRRARQEVVIGERAQADLPASAFSQVLNNGSYFAGCGAPDNLRIEVCAAVQNGRAIGVTVRTTPGDRRAAQCIAGSVRKLRFPRSGSIDVARTVYQPL